MRARRGVSERQEIGDRVADAVERALACTRPDAEADCPLLHRVKPLSLPPRNVTKAERDWAEQAHKESVAKGDATQWWPMNLKRVVDIHDGTRQAEPVPMELHVLRVGGLAIATNAFELFMDYGLRMKARSAAPQTMLVQLAGPGFYLPSARAVEGGGYGAMPAVCAAGPEAGQQLAEETVALIAELFE